MSKNSRPAQKGTWLAKDAFYEWRSRVKTAQSRILVLSPYLDDLVRTLLKSSPLDQSCTTVVTNLNPDEVSPTLLKQVRTLRKLIVDGVDVRHLDRLHAKVLLVDDTSVSIGSQNFTQYARKSRETTAFNKAIGEEEDLIRLVKGWILESIPVSEALLNDIESVCKAELKKMGEVLTRLSESIEQILDNESERIQQAKSLRHVNESRAANEEAKNQKKAEARRFRKLTESSSDVLRASMRWEGDDHVLKPDAYRRYPEIISDYRRLDHYPIYNLSSGRMGLARVGDTRISLVGSGWHDHIRIASHPSPVEVQFDFPDEGCEESNVHVTFSGMSMDFETFSWEPSWTTIKVLFDGVAVVLRDVESAGAADPFGACELFSNPKNLTSFLVEQFRHKRFKEGNLSGAAAFSFFGWDSSFEIGLSDVTPIPILVAREV